MATRKQRAANRRNAQLSTGPKTPEGKAAVRLNALKHGLTAENAVIDAEDVQDFDQLRREFEDHLQPAGPVEIALVQQIVISQWRLVRLRYIETGLFNHGLARNRNHVEERSEGPNHAQTLQRAFYTDTYTITKFGRYESRTERAFFRALHELQRLQAARQSPDSPPPAKTDFAEQSQIAPDTQPNPLPQNGLTPVAQDIRGGLLILPAHPSDRAPTARAARLPSGPSSRRNLVLTCLRSRPQRWSPAEAVGCMIASGQEVKAEVLVGEVRRKR